MEDVELEIEMVEKISPTNLVLLTSNMENFKPVLKLLLIVTISGRKPNSRQIGQCLN